MDVTFTTTSVFNKIAQAVNKYRTTIAYGGSSSSKSYSILQLLVLLAVSAKRKIAVATISYPVFKRGLLPDLQNIMGSMWYSCKYNKVDGTLAFPNGSVMYFINASDSNTAKGPRYDIFYADEVVLFPKDFYRQVAMRTKWKVLASMNPSNSGSWVRGLEAREDTIFLHSTYRDNEYLDPAIVKELNHFALTDKNFRDVYLEGKWGNREGLIFTDWEIGEFIGEPKYVGLDFAFSRHYTAAVALRQDGRTIYVKQVLYEIGIQTQGIVDILKPINKRVLADSSHKMIIDQMITLGVNVEPVSKYAGYVEDRISHAQSFHYIVDPGSINLIKALQIYSWQERNGEYINKPNHAYSDLPDSLMYGMTEFGFRSKVRVRGAI